MLLQVKVAHKNLLVQRFKEADIGNPKRLYFLRKDLQKISANQLAAVFQELLMLEFSLKTGNDPAMTLQIQAINICQAVK
jgi:DNA polymerase III subunit delta